MVGLVTKQWAWGRCSIRARLLVERLPIRCELRSGRTHGPSAGARWRGAGARGRCILGTADGLGQWRLGQWIARYFAIEDQDRRQLDDPVAAYIDTGGEILIAELNGLPVGCVALAPDGAGAYELSKMAISPELRGRGAGRTLLTAAIDHAQRIGARSLFLGSSTKLANAVHLYEAAGFQHVAPGNDPHALRPR